MTQLDLLSYNPRSAGEVATTFSRPSDGAVGLRERASLGHQFSGDTFSAPRDGRRLNAQQQSVFQLMRDSEWRTLQEIAGNVHAPEASCSARLRDCRKLGHTVNRKHLGNGLHAYQLIPAQ